MKFIILLSMVCAFATAPKALAVEQTKLVCDKAAGDPADANNVSSSNPAAHAKQQTGQVQITPR